VIVLLEGRSAAFFKIQFCDRSGDALLKIALDEDGQSLIELRDENEETKIALFVDEDGKGVATVFNHDRDAIGSLPKERDLFDYIGTAAQIAKIIHSIAGGS
jgi:hypothetical protein